MQPQQIKLPPLFGGDGEQNKQVSQLRKIDFTMAFKLCLLETKGEKPTVDKLKEWLKRSGVTISPQNFLETMYKEGKKNEKINF